MTLDQAKNVLLAYRGGQADATDPAMVEARSWLERDPGLRQWFEKHTTFQRTVRRSFQEIPVPPGLSARILLRARPPRKRIPRQHLAWYAAAAALVLFVGLTVFWRPPSREGSFATFRSRMVGAVLRQYTMDIVTNDMSGIRRFLASRQAPADYVLPPGLATLPASGAGVLSWQSRRVSMVCLDSPDQGTLFLFVVDQAAVRSSPAAQPQFQQVNKLMTVSWSQGGKVYLLAGSGGRENLQKRL